MVQVFLLSLRLSALVCFRAASKTGTVTVCRDDPSAVSDLAERSGYGQDPGFHGYAARLAGIPHVIVIGVRIRRDCVCAGQRWTNVAEGSLSIGISRCRTAGVD